MEPSQNQVQNQNPNPALTKIVIVEDDQALGDIYKTRLELLGYQCFVATDGIQALEVIERERPALVLLDILLPKVMGDQVLKVLRASDWGKNIKVLIISNLNETDAPAGIREQGIEGYAVKANLSNDMVDRMVDQILKPEDQTESVALDTPGTTVIK
jgi:two-component system response regulator MprA